MPRHRTGRSEEPHPRPQVTIGSLTIDSLEVALHPPLTFTATDQTQTSWVERELGVRLTTERDRLDDRGCGRALLPALAAAATQEGAEYLQRVGNALWPRVHAITENTTLGGLAGGRDVSGQEFRAMLRAYAQSHARE